MQKLIQEALAIKRETLLRKREVLRMTGLSKFDLLQPHQRGCDPARRSYRAAYQGMASQRD
jgi:hypothetical protein